MKNTLGNMKFPFTSVSLGLALFLFFNMEYAFKENIVKNETFFFFPLHEIAPGNGNQ